MSLKVNSWTEWGSLELVVVGSAKGMCYADDTPAYPWHHLSGDLPEYVTSFYGPRHPRRIELAQAQLDNLAEILRGECIQVTKVNEHEKDIQQQLERYRSTRVTNEVEDDRSVSTQIYKDKIQIWRSPSNDIRFDLDLKTPHFTSKYQFGLTCPRDVLITFGDTVVEAPTCFDSRYFEATYYKPLLSYLWSQDSNMKWLQPPKASCSPTTMFEQVDYWHRPDAVKRLSFSDRGYTTNLNESEIAFDAADMMRMGKDVFYKKSVSSTIKGLDWLRRTFPHLRFHMVHFPDDESPHIDVSLIPLRPPTSGSEGLVLISQAAPPLASQMKIFKDNDWRLVWCPKPVTDKLTPAAICSPNLNMNLLSLSEKCIIIEECELPLYRMLTDELGFDVITCPLRALNEFGGGIHCVTWDIQRRDSCKDYFPNQDYEAECKLDLMAFKDSTRYSIPKDN